MAAFRCAVLQPVSVWSGAVRIRAQQDRQRRNPEGDDEADRKAAEAFFSSVVSV